MEAATGIPRIWLRDRVKLDMNCVPWSLITSSSRPWSFHMWSWNNWATPAAMTQCGWYDVSSFGQMIHCYHDGVVTSVQRQSCDQIDQDNLPMMIGHSVGHKLTSG